MLRNSRALFFKLTQEQADTLNSLGFTKRDGVGDFHIVEVGDTYVVKTYRFCGVAYRLEICDREKVTLRSPCDTSWADDWKLSEFTKQMDGLLRELKNDISALRRAKIIS